MKLQTSSFKDQRSRDTRSVSLFAGQPSNRTGFRHGPWNFPGFWILKFEVSLLCLMFGVWNHPCSAADTNAVLNAWFAAQASVRTWSADFTQTRSLRTLTQPLVTQGHISFAAPSEFRWELGRPARTIAVRNGDEMFVVYPLLKRAEHYALGENTPKQFRDTMALLQAGFPRNRQEFESQFQILSLTQTNGDWLFSLQPKSVFARQMMPELRLNLTTNDFSLAATELVLVDGSRMRSDFVNGVVNPPLDPTLFNWTPPADFNITNPLAP